MIYGIENASLESPYSLIFSIVLFFGVVFIGDVFQKFLIKKINRYKFLNYNIFFSPIIGTYIFTFPLFILLILEIHSIFFIKFFSYLIFLFGFINIYLNKNLYFELIKKFKINNSLEIQIILILYLLFFLIAASPITHADSLDYHVSGAINLFNYGHFQKEIIPMHNNLVSIGEIPLSLGLYMGAEQFGGIIQFSSLFSLIPIFFKKKQNKLFLIGILACPVTLFLVSSPKPQLFYCVTILLIFIFLIEYFPKLKTREKTLFFFLGLLIIAMAFLAKFSFILSSSLLLLYSLFIFYKNKIFFIPILTGILVFIITILPHWFFRYQNFDTNFINLFISPIPLNIYGYEGFHNLLSGGSIDLLSIFFVKDLQKLTNTYGLLFLILIFMMNNKVMNHKFPLMMITVFIIFVLIFGSNLNRFLYEGYLWLIFLASITYNKKTKIYSFFSKIVLLQSILIIFISLIYTATIFPGSLNKNLKKNVMINNANGYELASWVNNKLDEKDVLISTHRSISLFNMKTYSSIFTWFVDPKNEYALKYANHLKSKKINRIVFYGNKLEKEPFQNCLGKKLFYKENVGRHVGRNPFTEKNYYDGWVFEFQYEKLPNCFIK